MEAQIRTGPMGDAASPKAQLAAGPPKAPVKKATPPAYEANTTAMLGRNPLDTANGGAVSMDEAGLAGKAYGYTAMLVKGAQGLSTMMPGIVPEEVQLWLEALMQLIPQAVEQLSSNGNVSGMAAAAGAGTGPAAMMGGGGMGMPAQMPMAGPAAAPPQQAPQQPVGGPMRQPMGRPAI